MHEKTVPLTNVIGIVVALIASRFLSDTTEWNVIAVVAASLGIAVVVTGVIVFLGGALGFSTDSSDEK